MALYRIQPGVNSDTMLWTIHDIRDNSRFTLQPIQYHTSLPNKDNVMLIFIYLHLLVVWIYQNRLSQSDDFFLENLAVAALIFDMLEVLQTNIKLSIVTLVSKKNITKVITLNPNLIITLATKLMAIYKCLCVGDAHPFTHRELIAANLLTTNT
ncbi:hypothetical protein ACJX0J_019178, partial [Zea mays]